MVITYRASVLVPGDHPTLWGGGCRQKKLQSNGIYTHSWVAYVFSKVWLSCNSKIGSTADRSLSATCSLAVAFERLRKEQLGLLVFSGSGPQRDVKCWWSILHCWSWRYNMCPKLLGLLKGCLRNVKINEKKKQPKTCKWEALGCCSGLELNLEQTQVCI